MTGSIPQQQGPTEPNRVDQATAPPRPKNRAVPVLVSVSVVAVIAVVVAVVAATGRNSTSPPASSDDTVMTTSSLSDPEQAFLVALRSRGFPTDAGVDQDLINLGHGVCTDFEDGSNLGSIESRLYNAGFTDPAKAGAIISAAVQDLCPQYLDRL